MTIIVFTPTHYPAYRNRHYSLFFSYPISDQFMEHMVLRVCNAILQQRIDLSCLNDVLNQWFDLYRVIEDLVSDRSWNFLGRPHTVIEVCEFRDVVVAGIRLYVEDIMNALRKTTHTIQSIQSIEVQQQKSLLHVQLHQHHCASTYPYHRHPQELPNPFTTPTSF